MVTPAQHTPVDPHQYFLENALSDDQATYDPLAEDILPSHSEMAAKAEKVSLPLFTQAKDDEKTTQTSSSAVQKNLSKSELFAATQKEITAQRAAKRKARKQTKEKNRTERTEEKKSAADLVKEEATQKKNDDSVKGFKLVPLAEGMNKANPPEYCVDRSGLAHDYSKRALTYKFLLEIAFEHTTNRITLFFEMSKYLFEKRGYLKGTSIPYGIPDQFKAVVYGLKNNDKKTPKGYEKAHIGLFNKFVFQKGNDLFKMEGIISFKGKEFTLRELFNVCNIAPATLNAIDGYMECVLRIDALKLLNQVKDEKLSVSDSVENFCRSYADEGTNLSNGKPKLVGSPKNKTNILKHVTKIKAKEKHATPLLAGMIQAAQKYAVVA